MKKLTRIVTILATILSLSVVPVAVHAEDDSGVISVGDSSSSSSSSSTSPTDTSAGVPNTGVAPRSSFLQSTAVFIGGSAVGAAVGVGVIAFRKQRQSL